MADNTLYYGDNLDILRRYIPDGSVDLIYLDPPFNSKADYNVLFAEHDGSRSAAQIKAFEDTWHWSAAAPVFFETVEQGGPVSQALQAFRLLLGEADMLAYLSMMAPRLVELRRVLKPTGSLYLHCDPTASHYLKVLLDAVFRPENFRSEIIWKRTSAHASSRRSGPVHDTLLFYTRGQNYTWNQVYQPLPQETIDQWYNNVEPDTGRRFNRADLTAAGVRTGPSGAPWRDIDPTAKGRHWAIPGFAGEIINGLITQDALDALDAAGWIFWPKRADGIPMLKRYLDESKGVPAVDVITDIGPLRNMTAERLGYPTQKPEALLERIIQASSNAGDVVLDPFCGCGTATVVAHRLGRRWIGIDVTQLAITAIKNRLLDAFGEDVTKAYRVVGEPTTLSEAEALAAQDKYQFQYWALGLVGARPTEEKKGADKGIDGRLYFHDEAGATKQVIFQVKGGHTDARDVRDLVGTIGREKAEVGVLISLQEPTRPMRDEAASAGMYTSPWDHKAYPRLQLLTVAELLDGQQVRLPALRHTNITYQRGQRASREAGYEQANLLGGGEAEE